MSIKRLRVSEDVRSVTDLKLHAADICGALHWLADIEPRCADSTELHLLRANCYAAQGKKEEAFAVLQRTFALDPSIRTKALDDPAFAVLW